jgi:hypothetical protein
MRFFFYSLLMVLCACAPAAKVNDSWVAKDIHSRDLHGVLVVAMATKESTRKMFEQDFSNALRGKDVNAVASYTLRPGTKITKKDVIAMSGKAGVDTVLVTSFAGRDSNEVLHPGRTYYGRRPVYGGDYYGRGRIYSVPYEVGRSPDFWAEHKSLHLEASLYEVSTEELLWRASAGIEDTSDIDSMLKSFVASFMKQLSEEILVR